MSPTTQHIGTMYKSTNFKQPCQSHPRPNVTPSTRSGGPCQDTVTPPDKSLNTRTTQYVMDSKEIMCILLGSQLLTSVGVTRNNNSLSYMCGKALTPTQKPGVGFSATL